MPNYPKKQHYVPQFLLRNFSNNNSLSVFDKHTEKTFRSSIKNVGCENGFYDLINEEDEDERVRISLEESLSKIDGDASNVIRKILESDSIDTLTEEERITLEVFITIQMYRGNEARNKVRDFTTGLGDKIRSMGMDPNLMEGFSENENDMRLSSLLMMMDTKAISEIASILHTKHMVLLMAPVSHSFIIGDNPITLQNSMVKSEPFFGNLGIGVKGIEIYLPISSTMCIALYCPSLIGEMRKAVFNIMKAFLRFGDSFKLPTKGVTLTNRVIENLRQFDQQKKMTLDPENLVNLNSLQVIHSSRFLYSSDDHFELARTMINDNPKFRYGRRMEVR